LLITPDQKVNADWQDLPVISQGIAQLLEDHDELDKEQVSQTMAAYRTLCSGEKRARALQLSSPTNCQEFALPMTELAAAVEDLPSHSQLRLRPRFHPAFTMKRETETLLRGRISTLTAPKSVVIFTTPIGVVQVENEGVVDASEDTVAVIPDDVSLATVASCGIRNF
jgi:hypothetical protein